MKYDIKVIYSDLDAKELAYSARSIFLAGPTPRSPDVKSWRPEAIECFEELGYFGNIIVPEPQNGVWKHRDAQIDWEQYYLNRCDVVMFWVPRNMLTMPALTTNIEFGMYLDSGKLVFGAPPEAEHVWYMQYCCKQRKISTGDSLHKTCELANSFMNKILT